MLGQFTEQKETDGRLDFAVSFGRVAVVVGQTERLGGNALEDVVHE